jgi:two-component system cell cycle sensor histidine kinase/response regulator CckA
VQGSDGEAERLEEADPSLASVSGGSSDIILLVEDEDFVRAVTREVLLFAGYRVLSARSTPEARDSFTNCAQPISLLLTDLKLPGGDGCTLARQLMAAQPNLKVIVISGYPQTQLQESERQLAGITYLAKPFSTDSLLRTVRAALVPSGEPPSFAKSAAAS